MKLPPSTLLDLESVEALFTILSHHLDERVEELKLAMHTAETPSQKNCLGTTILTVSAISVAIKQTIHDCNS
jgi:hypothetical protein